MTDETCHVSSTTTTAYPLLINPTTFIPSQMYAQPVPLMLFQPALPTFSHDIPTIIITPSPPPQPDDTSSQDAVSEPPSEKSVIVNVKEEDPVAPRPCLKDRFMTLLFSGCMGTALSYLVSSSLLADRFELMTAYNVVIFIATIISMLIPVVLLPLVETKGGQLTTFKRVTLIYLLHIFNIYDETGCRLWGFYHSRVSRGCLCPSREPPGNHLD